MDENALLRTVLTYVTKTLTKYFIEKHVMTTHQFLGYMVYKKELMLYIISITNSKTRCLKFGNRRIKYIQNLLNQEVKQSYNDILLTEEQAKLLYTLFKLQGY